MLFSHLGRFVALVFSTVPVVEQASRLAASSGMLFSFDELGWLIVTICAAGVVLALLPAMRASRFVTFAGLTVIFIACATLLVSVNNILLFLAIWELTATVAWAIGRTSLRNFNSGLGPLATSWVGSLGSLAMLISVILLVVQSGTLSMDALHTDRPEAIAIAILAAVSFKSLGLLSMAWFPGRRDLFAPANALLAGPCLIVLGVFPYLRLTRLALATNTGWQNAILWISLAIAVLFALAALKEKDLHRIATDIVFAQFYVLIAGFTLADQQAIQSTLLGVAGYVVGAVGLFLTIGLVVEASGTRNIGRTPALVTAYPALAVLFLLSATSLVGVPPLVGFASKTLLSVEMLSRTSSLPLLWAAVWLVAALGVLRAFQLAFMHMPEGEAEQTASLARISRQALIPPGIAVAMILCASLWQTDLLAWLGRLATTLVG